MPPEVRAYLVAQLRTVAGNQRWGVWGAGAAAQPGNSGVQTTTTVARLLFDGRF